jgi:hypothetical protein
MEDGESAGSPSETWISWLVSLHGHEWLVEVDASFIGPWDASLAWAAFRRTTP